ncbi:orotidine 5'-phosphate decarboxylase [Snodgrassella communis]|jgi:orotidine-5'-phosphate decarboxylase|nr:orotidine-5'-phosphate decarboxylase [Snodgrassella communis]PIT11483.1 orotidine 5'-phosphate decarboxylase [Snodgrassella communis]PIT21142.1 orotidine 5'-phosphate decarboxylase [Snodgrassella communis]PIT26900.1 orotidine 5'-phosphate decarboxylase [Snodgrassella communis]PIT29681.1 orotidine 5'-phosphate decarboxylase [Snodgrassella communis]PIT32535.1 orotidine 5'-phosphate decarboxylase [Snodgrassella communis]
MNPLMLDTTLINQPAKPVIVALDFANAESTLDFVQQLNPNLCQLKIGKELFTATGRYLVEQLVLQGYRVFLDLKYHDIPNTVASACKVAADMGVWMVDMHASGGRRMMEAAAEAVSNCSQPPLLIAVTVLTSMTQAELAETGLNLPIEEVVMRLAELTRQSGLDGVVCSAQEASLLRQQLGEEFLLVTPGIRLHDAIEDDQRRIMAPKAALAAGSSYLVMGRPITRNENPAEVLLQINNGLI